MAEGFTVFDGKEQVTSGTVTIDPATAAQLIAAGAVESQGAAARRPKEKWRGLGRANP